ncbi:hypothetical protein [Vibrio sp. SCSIO 43136]|uniref:hypothetical protein n=1 Tax=Vibrio sp. SCSIO 43136 TaxID=2819101 RepID=UPI002075712D|nr:hypothetical protein [Vibrio sp. SCSIO 43136]USD64196.1 hypothetical protein J4N39_08740 [Vibrio sp. SCSIO 43136]
MALSTLSEMETCFLLKLSPVDVAAIRCEPYELACSEVLYPGDAFTEIGSSGSAGNQPVAITPPWVQRYQGLLCARSECFEWLPSIWHGRDLVLFDAFNPEDLGEGFVSQGYRAGWEGTRSMDDGYFIAYLRHSDDNTLFHTRGSTSSSVCKCTSLTRWHAEQYQATAAA